GSVGQLVLWRPALVAGGPFLQRALRVLGAAGVPLDLLAPQLADEIAGGVEPTLDEARAEQCFHHVAKDVVALGSAVVARLLAETDVGGGTDLAGDGGAGLPADE